MCYGTKLLFVILICTFIKDCIVEQNGNKPPIKGAIYFSHEETIPISHLNWSVGHFVGTLHFVLFVNF